MKYFIILILFIPACSKIPIRDSEWCGDIGGMGASCFHTLTTETRDLNKSDWDFERFGMVCTKSQTFADIKASIEKLCSVSTVRCSYEIKEIMEHVSKNLKEIAP